MFSYIFKNKLILSFPRSQQIFNLNQFKLAIPSRYYCTDDADHDAENINRYNYALATEIQINKQIGNELHASHTYLSMATYFARTDIGLIGTAGK